MRGQLELVPSLLRERTHSYQADFLRFLLHFCDSSGSTEFCVFCVIFVIRPDPRRNYFSYREGGGGGVSEGFPVEMENNVTFLGECFCV